NHSNNHIHTTIKNYPYTLFFLNTPYLYFTPNPIPHLFYLPLTQLPFIIHHRNPISSFLSLTSKFHIETLITISFYFLFFL
ncbi:hypothetical protein, partial [Bacillus pumilus]|uniref:hypothetical protein n=1 Tax=Bacillus pumilus TaxID=1408 RepID=UPI001C92C7CA